MRKQHSGALRLPLSAVSVGLSSVPDAAASCVLTLQSEWVTLLEKVIDFVLHRIIIFAILLMFRLL